MTIPFKLLPGQQKVFDEWMEKTIKCSTCKEDFKMLNVSIKYLHLRGGGISPVYTCKPCRQTRELLRNNDKTNQ